MVVGNRNLVEDSSIEDVYVFAMKAEQKAYELYSELAGLELEEKAKAMFAALAAEEKKHKEGLEVEYEKECMREG